MTIPASGPYYPPERLLLGAGPSAVDSRVLHAMSVPLLGHLDRDFLVIMDEVGLMLRELFRTKNSFTIAVSGTGTLGMEAAFINMLEHGDTAVVAVNGYFGLRAADIAERAGAKVICVEHEWGKPVDPDMVEAAVKKAGKVKVVAMTHAETSTGVKSSVKEIADLSHRHGALVLVDCVTSIGGEQLEMDAWDIDVAFGATQKCLGAPPGLAPVAFGPRSLEVLDHRKSKVQSLYLDMTLLKSYWGTGQRVYHHTAPISMVFALREALRLMQVEGLENRWRRHATVAAMLRAGVKAMGLSLFAQESALLNPLTAIRVPEGVNDAAFRADLLNKHSIEIGAGLGPAAGKVWRIGLMGENARVDRVLRFLSVIERLLPAHGYEVAQGVGVAAAQRELARLEAM